ncbi:helix-turn-helix domain-containing protein [Lachnoclostridium edouardi]|uniref:helix-turn-helix domain-containing protein n=1 Tax=Lachnoclostridium edouardi TaxID=1926283 RepID=UPI000C7C4248
MAQNVLYHFHINASLAESCRKLATLASISQSYLRDIELGKKNPTVEVLSYICEALEISLRDFFDEESTARLFGDPLLSSLYQLTEEQKNALIAFIKTLNTQFCIIPEYFPLS